MSPTLLRAQGPAARAAHALNDKLDDVAAGVRELLAQPEPPPPPQKVAVIEEKPKPRAEAEGRIPKAEASLPPRANETPTAASSVEAKSETSLPVVRTPAPARERVDLPPLVDLRPELAAFTAAMAQQRAATVYVLRQATEACQNVLRVMDRHSAELERLDRRIQNLSQRP